MGEFDQFEKAFDMHISGPVAECNCGRIFWDSYNSGYDWSEGEKERLSENPKATAVPYGVQRISLEGRYYCSDCDCWHERARRIEDWLRDNQEQIAEWFKLEKRRREKAAAEVPVIEAQ
jgi:hypothetical protein